MQPGEQHLRAQRYSVDAICWFNFRPVYHVAAPIVGKEHPLSHHMGPRFSTAGESSHCLIPQARRNDDEDHGREPARGREPRRRVPFDVWVRDVVAVLRERLPEVAAISSLTTDS